MLHLECIASIFKDLFKKFNYKSYSYEYILFICLFLKIVFESMRVHVSMHMGGGAEGGNPQANSPLSATTVGLESMSHEIRT